MSGDAEWPCKAVSDELAYFTQLAEAVGEGKNPVLDSSGQVAYLRSVGKTDQADAYLDLHGQLLSVLDDPAFPQVGGRAWATPPTRRAISRALDGAAAPGADDGLRTRALDPEVRSTAAGGPGEVAGGDYGANRDLMNGQLGDNDYARVPDDQPEGFENGRAGRPDASDGTGLADPDVPTEADLDQSIRQAAPDGGDPDANAVLNGQLDSAQSPPGDVTGLTRRCVSAMRASSRSSPTERTYAFGASNGIGRSATRWAGGGPTGRSRRRC